MTLGRSTLTPSYSNTIPESPGFKTRRLPEGNLGAQFWCEYGSVLFSPPGNPSDSTWTHGIHGLSCGLHGLVIKINKL